MPYVWKTVVPPVFVSEFTSIMEKIMKDPANHQRLANANWIDLADRVRYKSYAVVTPDGKTYWKIYTEDMDKQEGRDPNKDVVYIHQSSQAPNVEYMVSFRGPSNDENRLNFIRHGPFRAIDKKDMINLMAHHLMEEGMEIKQDLTKLERSFNYKSYWDVQSQLAAYANKRKCHSIGKTVTGAFLRQV